MHFVIFFGGLAFLLAREALFAYEQRRNWRRGIATERVAEERAINDALSPEAKARIAWVPEAGHHITDDELWADFGEIWEAGIAITHASTATS